MVISCVVSLIVPYPFLIPYFVSEGQSRFSVVATGWEFGSDCGARNIFSKPTPSSLMLVVVKPNPTELLVVFFVVCISVPDSVISL